MATDSSAYSPWGCKESDTTEHCLVSYCYPHPNRICQFGLFSYRSKYLVCMLLSVLSQLCLKGKRLKFLYNIFCCIEVDSHFSKQLLYSNLVKNVHLKEACIIVFHNFHLPSIYLLLLSLISVQFSSV